MRIGQGYDIHRFGEGGTLVLGGIEFPAFPCLSGHSDGDVVLHAVADSLLGAAALGDIGDHFPDNSERWLDADSAELLAIVADMIHEEGYEVVNLDVSVICERPRLGEKKREVRERIAGLLGVSPDVISIKARTKEGLGPVGEGAAIEAYAVVLIEG